MQFADGTVICSQNMDGIKESLIILKSVGRCSGLNINKDKTELVKLSNVDKFPEAVQGLKWCTKAFKYLCIWFSFDQSFMEYKFFRHKLDKIKNLLKMWKLRS